MELITIKEYCKRENITDAGARKRVSSKLVKSVILEEMLYIVEENNEKQEHIKTLKNRLRNANDRIKLLTAEKQTVIDQKEHIRKLEEKIEKLETLSKEKIEKLEAKIETITEKKEELYEKVIGHFSMLQIPQK